MKNGLLVVVGLVIGLLLGVYFGSAFFKRAPKADVLDGDATQGLNASSSYEKFMHDCMQAAGWTYPIRDPAGTPKDADDWNKALVNCHEQWGSIHTAQPIVPN